MKTVWEATQVMLPPGGSVESAPLRPPAKKEGQKADWSLQAICAGFAGSLVVVWVGKVEADG